MDLGRAGSVGAENSLGFLSATPLVRVILNYPLSDRSMINGGPVVSVTS